MKIAFVAPETNPVPPVKGGAVQSWIENVAIRINFCEVFIFSSYDKNLPYYEKRNQVVYYHFKPGILSRLILCTYKLPFKNDNSILYYLPYSFWCAFKLREIKPNIVHIHNRPHFVWIIKLLNPRAKIILHIHQKSALLDRKIFSKSFFKKVDLFLGSSKFIASLMQKQFLLSENKIGFIYNGVDIKQFTPAWRSGEQRERLKNDFGLDGKKVFLYVGRIVENKGVDIIIDAFRNIVKNVSKEVILFICGGRTYSDNSLSDYLKKLHELVNDIKDNVIFTGYVPHEEIYKYYSIADVVLVPSRVKEGFCVITIEAMAMGVPVIATNRGAISELIESGFDGILVDSPDIKSFQKAMEDFIVSSRNYLEIAINGRKKAEKEFHWDKITSDLKDIYLRLLKNG
jgi:spore coat protein SA